MDDDNTTTSAPTPRWTVHVRGPLRLDTCTACVELRPKERSVLAALVVTHPGPADTDQISALIWGHGVPISARKSIQNASAGPPATS